MTHTQKKKSFKAYIYILLSMESIILVNKSDEIADHGGSKLVKARTAISKTG